MTRYEPARAEFVRLAAHHALVPVRCEVLADLVTPLGVYDRLRAAGPPTFLLESVEQGERWGRHSFIGLQPLLTIVARDGEVRVDGDAPDSVVDAARSGDPLATLEVLLRALRPPQLDGLPPLYAGLVGYLGWGVAGFIERLGDSGVDDQGWDDVRLMLPGQLIAFDHLRQTMAVVTNVLVDPHRAGEQYDAAVAASERLIDRLGAAERGAPPVEPPRASRVEDVAVNMPRESFLDAVERSLEHIRAGDVFQVVPSQRFTLETRADPFTVYRVLRVINPSPYLYLFDWGDGQIVGSSPEALVTARDGVATIQPIAGSRPRAEDEAEDLLLADELLADAKERAEHIMLVDLARNDLGRICEVGSVRVSDLMSVVRYSHIMHLVTTVQGRLRAEVGGVDVVRATFPAGTLSGAPKVRAMTIIDDLEPTRRGPYAGGIGYLDLAGDVDLCIAIRTLLFRDGKASVQAGAGIVADSVGETEYEETKNKAMALLAAVRAAEALER